MSEQRAFFYLKYKDRLEINTVYKSDVKYDPESETFTSIKMLARMGPYVIRKADTNIEYIVIEDNKVYLGAYDLTEDKRYAWIIPCKNEKVANIVYKHLFKVAGKGFINAAI